MNDFALNDAEIDGEPRIWLEDDCFAVFSLSGAGSSLFATPLGGISSVTLSPAWPPQIKKQFAGDAVISFTGGLPLSLGYSVVGSAPAALIANGELLRKAMAASNASVVMDSTFTATVFTPPKADFFIQLQGSAELSVSRAVFGEYLEPLVICETDSTYQRDFATHHAEGLMSVRVNAEAKLNVWMYSPSADSVISTQSQGDGDTGKKIALESDTITNNLFVKGDAILFHYVQIGGDASITLQNRMEIFSRIATMTKSPNSRMLFVSKQDRTLTVTG